MLTWTVIAADWALRLVMIAVILLRKKPGEALPWLLICIAFPLPGMLLYLLIGGRRLGVRRSREHQRAMKVIDGLRRLGERGVSGGRADIPPERHDLADMAERIAEMPTVGGNDAELIGEPLDYLDRLIADIDGARSYVHMIFYIFEDDAAGRRVAEAMKAAAARGVRVRLLADAVGSRPFFRNPAGTLAELRAAGVSVRDMLPVNPLRRKLSRIDLRNHRKLVVIDGSVCYTGSQNIIDPIRVHDAPASKSSPATEHAVTAGGTGGTGGFGSRGSSASLARAARSLFQRRKREWADLNVRLVGPIALQGDVVFLEDWYHATQEVLHESPGDGAAVPLPRRVGDVVAQMVPSGPSYPVDVFHHFIVATLHDAQRSIELCTPYFVPDEPVLLALKIAAARGVTVDLILPGSTDHLMVNLAARSHFEELLNAGVRIHQYQGLMIHAKSLLIDDDFAIIGSGNIDMRSFYLNFELNLVLYSHRFAEALRAQHEKYRGESRQVDAREWSRRPLSIKLLERAVGLLGPLL